MHRGEGRDDDGDEHARAHPELADGQTAEHRGQGERHPIRRADQPVRTITAFLRHQEGDRRREGDGSQVAGDRAAEHERDERPQEGLTEIPQRRIRSDDEYQPGEREGRERERAREQHRGLAQVPVDEGPEEHRRDGDQEHVSAADDRRGQDGPGLEVHPERQREPQEVVRDVGHERVRDEQMEGTHQVTSMTAHGQVAAGSQPLDRQVTTCLCRPPWTCSRPLPIPPGGPSSTELTERDGQTLFELCGRLLMKHGIDSTRQAISQHLDVLEGRGSRQGQTRRSVQVPLPR